MDKSARSVLIAFACIAMLGTFVYSFWMARRNAQNPQTIRQTMASSATAACIQKAKSGTVTTQQASQYCECVVSRGLESFSDDEIVAAAQRGANLNQSDREKFMAPVALCRLRTFNR